MDRVLALCDRLREDGVEAWIDQYETAPPEGWPLWCEKQVAAADFVLVVCTELYERRFRGDEAPGTGLGVRWEGYVVRQELYDAGALNTKYIPLLWSPAGTEQVPLLLRGATRYGLDRAEAYQDLYRHLTGQPKTPAPPLGSRVSMPVARKHYGRLFPPLVGTSTHLPPQAQLEIVVKADKEVDYVELIPAFSSVDLAQRADLAVLSAGLWSIEIINHSDRPTEILRLWLGLAAPLTQREIKPREVKEEDLTGIRRIEPWSRQRYRLKFTSVFDGSPQQDWRQRVMLGVKAIGIGELHTRLDFFQEDDEPGDDGGVEPVDPL